MEELFDFFRQIVYNVFEIEKGCSPSKVKQPISFTFRTIASPLSDINLSGIALFFNKKRKQKVYFLNRKVV